MGYANYIYNFSSIVRDGGNLCCDSPFFCKGAIDQSVIVKSTENVEPEKVRRFLSFAKKGAETIAVYSSFWCVIQMNTY